MNRLHDGPARGTLPYPMGGDVRATVLCLLFAGCQAIEPVSSPTGVFGARPVDATATPAPTPEAPAPTPAGGFDFDADAPDPDAEPEESDTTRADVLAGLGLPTSEADAVPLAVEPVAAPAPVAAVAEPAGWTPAMGMSGSFGERLVATLPNAQPPRAILGLADGSEVVVEPGDLLPAARLVVLAIGRDAAHVAEIVPEGDRARVVPTILTALHPTGSFPRE